MSDESIPPWLRIEERSDGPAGFPYAVVIRDEVATWSKTIENAEVMQRALTRAWYAEISLEAQGLLDDTDLPPNR